MRHRWQFLIALLLSLAGSAHGAEPAALGQAIFVAAEIQSLEPLGGAAVQTPASGRLKAARLTFNNDGSFTLELPGSPVSPLAGRFNYREGVWTFEGRTLPLATERGGHAEVIGRVIALGAGAELELRIVSNTPQLHALRMLASVERK